MAGMPAPTTISTKQARIATLAKQMSGTAIRTLSSHMDLEWVREAVRLTRKDGAVGIDGQTAADYAENLDANLADLLDRAKSGRYRAPPVRRVEIPKGNGKTRSLGIPTYEDKVLQRAVKMLLEPLYEQDFYDFSYGYRPRRSAQDALAALRAVIEDMRGGWVLEADVSKFFDTLDHKQLQQMLRQRVADGVVLRLCGKWLNAGVMSEGSVEHPEFGTPQGGVISPLLANIYLHEVLDRWWVEDVLPRMRGRAALIRYADDFVMVFSEEADARRVFEVLPKRFARYALTLHPEKTRLVPFRQPRSGSPGTGTGTFDFVGFTLHWGQHRRGRWNLWAKTARGRFTRSLSALYEWMKRARHTQLAEQARQITEKLKGHYDYYGVPSNADALKRFRYEVMLKWFKALKRRSQRGLKWRAFEGILERHPLPRGRIRPKGMQLRLANV